MSRAAKHECGCVTRAGVIEKWCTPCRAAYEETHARWAHEHRAQFPDVDFNVNQKQEQNNGQ